MQSTGTRIVLVAGGAAVVVSWALGAVETGVTARSTVTALGLVMTYCVLFGAVLVIDSRSHRQQQRAWSSGASSDERSPSLGD